MTNEVEQVLTNWIDIALSPQGKLPSDVKPAQWVAEKFLRWWRQDFEGHLDEWIGDAERALSRVRSELERLGGWEKCGEALHECIHLSDALGILRQTLVKEMFEIRQHTDDPLPDYSSRFPSEFWVAGVSYA